ncbi:MAG: hypothetical protein IPN33_17050 [Saprospiraceae bacterium]|nr:hypothetical protein [Saprospiraceae bacterium]
MQTHRPHRIAITGPESTGKSTLARDLAPPPWRALGPNLRGIICPC